MEHVNAPPEPNRPCALALYDAGLLVSLTLKFSDNVVKTFATAIALVCSVVGSAFLFQAELPRQFILGVAVVLAANFAFAFDLQDTDLLLQTYTSTAMIVTCGWPSSFISLRSPVATCTPILSHLLRRSPLVLDMRFPFSPSFLSCSSLCL